MGFCWGRGEEEFLYFFLKWGFWVWGFVLLCVCGGLVLGRFLVVFCYVFGFVFGKVFFLVGCVLIFWFSFTHVVCFCFLFSFKVFFCQFMFLSCFLGLSIVFVQGFLDCF